jgi:predicted dehydrogenase
MRNGYGLRAAIVGTGFVGEVHLDALRRLGVQVSGVLSSSPPRSVEEAERIGVSRGYRSLTELLDDPTVDVVHITSPNHLHHEQAMASLAAGKHVVCEKPLALTSAETAELSAAAAASGLVNAVNFNVRFYPQIRESRAHVRAGLTGSPWLMTGHYFQDWLSRETDWNWRLDPRKGGELRAVGDVGTHWLDTTSYILGATVAEVCADLATHLPTRLRPTGPVRTFSGETDATAERVTVAGEDSASLLLRWDNGTRGAVTVSQVSPGRKNHIAFELSGAKESLAWNGERPDELWIGHRSTPNQTLLRDPSLLDSSADALMPGGHVEGFENTFAALYRAVCSHIADRETPVDFPTFADGHQEALILDAVTASAAARTWATVAPNPFRSV